MHRDKIKEYIEANKEAAIDLWGKIVSIDSGSLDKAGVDKVIDVVKGAMEESGFETKIYEMEKHIRELERSNDILKEALGFFASSRKK